MRGASSAEITKMGGECGLSESFDTIAYAAAGRFNPGALRKRDSGFDTQVLG
jgi:hypothetical protein